MGCVYLITCTASGKRYVGLTKFSADVRFAGHLRDALRGKPTALHNAIRKHGACSFSIETIFESDDRAELCAKEQALIAELGTRRPLGYNITGGGEAPFGPLNNRFGAKHTAATKKKMSENNAMRNPLHRAKLQGTNHPMYGKKHTAAALDKMAAGKRGQIKMHDAETLRECNVDPKYEGLFIELGYVRGRPPMSEDWVRHMAEAAKGRRASSETKSKMSEVRRAAGLKKNTPVVGAISNMVSAGFTRREIATVLFIKPERVKQLRQTYNQLGRGVTIDHGPD